MNILLVQKNYLRFGSKSISEIEYHSVMLKSVFKDNEFKYFLAFENIDDDSLDINLDEYYFTENERFHISEKTSIQNLCDFINNNNISIIQIQEIGKFNISAFKEISIKTGCPIIFVCHTKPTFELQKISLINILNNIKFGSPINKIKALTKYLIKPILKVKIEKQIKNLYQNIFKYCDKIVLPSETYISTMESIIQRKIDFSEITIISNYLEENIQFPLKHLSKLKQKEVLIYSYLDEFSNINLILDIWQIIQEDYKYSNWTLRIIGDGPLLKKLKKKYTNKKNILFEGLLPIKSFMKTASIYLNINNSSSIWNSNILLAMKCATVPIVFDSSEIFHEIIKNEYNGFIVPYLNKDVLTQVLKNLMDDDMITLNIAQNAIERSYSFSELNIKNCYKKLYLNTKRTKNVQ